MISITHCRTRICYAFCAIFIFYKASAQVTTSPAIPIASQPVTITVDVSATGLEGYANDVWIWAWIEQGAADLNAPTNINPATSAQDAAKMIRSQSDPDIYTITLTPTEFFGVSEDQIEEIGLLLKGRDWSNGQTPDYSFTVSQAGFSVSFVHPSRFPIFLNQGQTLSIEGAASELAELSLWLNGSQLSSNNGTSINYELTAGSPGQYQIQLIGNNGEEEKKQDFSFLVRQSTIQAELPAFIIPGINYDQNDASVATLCLQAPNKESVYIIGDFNDWEPNPDYQMYQDGDYFWLQVSGLNAGQEYAFQYLVDETIQIADPYADKILDPQNDPYISEETYPGLKAYPESNLANGIVAVMETGQLAYSWEVTDFEKPANEDLVIYELLIRDFDERHDYQGILNHLDYLKGLGINAIELMPIMEIDGNLSWGYNPFFFFAPDKYYGSKNELKHFVDECHKNGIAVILDMVLNHTHEKNPLAALYWDDQNYRPAADNPWLNQEATHPFNVFYDFNHESDYTKAFVDTVNHYWINEYKIDGYRFDLTKGFTQNYNTDVDEWSSYDQSRIDILTRMTDAIWESDPSTYVIFEHLAENSEETVLADYGIMLWGNMNYNYSQNTMGYADGSGISWAYYGTRNWKDSNLISYMESHDEERVMFKNKQYGNTTADYTTRELSEAIDRTVAAAAFYYLIPGPKMLWQFGELGYDISIDENGRTGEKPLPWSEAPNGLDYDVDPMRIELYEAFSELISLKNDYGIFRTSQVDFMNDNTLQKELLLTNETDTDAPASAAEMDVYVMGNFGLSSAAIRGHFTHTGSWYDYFSGQELVVKSADQSVNLSAGEFRIYTDYRISEEPITSLNPFHDNRIKVFPNPVTQYLEVQNQAVDYDYSIVDINGREVLKGHSNPGNLRLSVQGIPSGWYLLKITGQSSTKTMRFIKQ
ncbi:alpha-amylase family glycosyl hydrolase [Fulvivirga sediminis]|uniref:T9SS type A sorting domain-containing protein n=1 Tax=Fulvivirga sediminis TaxID=2803949 RepID=A0A937F830_9BACT|nr:alpha-amylase family glycosyl hydrolase [Fulvivirga sediminis]MBL3655713.1 T9SS type A sorting domain-containing protein [Fulvivirga sediminis]